MMLKKKSFQPRRLRWFKVKALQRIVDTVPAIKRRTELLSDCEEIAVISLELKAEILLSPSGALYARVCGPGGATWAVYPEDTFHGFGSPLHSAVEAIFIQAELTLIKASKKPKR